MSQLRFLESMKMSYTLVRILGDTETQRDIKPWDSRYKYGHIISENIIEETLLSFCCFSLLKRNSTFFKNANYSNYWISYDNNITTVITAKEFFKKRYRFKRLSIKRNFEKFI